jgi:hypothetical protein
MNPSEENPGEKRKEALQEKLRERGLIVSGNPSISHLEGLLEDVLFPLEFRNDSTTQKLVQPVQKLCESKEIELGSQTLEFLVDFIPFLCHEFTRAAMVERNRRVKQFRERVESGIEKEEDLDPRLTCLDFQNVYRAPNGEKEDGLFTLDEKFAKKIYDEATDAITYFYNVFLKDLSDNPGMPAVIERFGEEEIQEKVELSLPVSVIDDLIREEGKRASASSSAVVYVTTILETFLLGLLEDTKSVRIAGTDLVSLDVILFVNGDDRLFRKRLDAGLRSLLENSPIPKAVSEVIWDFIW